MPKRRPPLLTKSKTAWVDKFKPKVLRGQSLNYNAALQDRYHKQLQALVAQMTEQVERAVSRLFNGDAAEEYFAEDASISSQARMLTNNLMSTFNSLFARRAKPLSEQMVSNADKVSKSVLHSSLKELSGGLMIKTDIMPGDLGEALNAATWENVQLIKSISSDYLGNIQGQVMRSLQPGD